MDYIRAFVCGGIICVLTQILMEKTKLMPGRIMVILVTTGVVLGAVGIYEPFAKFAGAGATVPLTGFGNVLWKGTKKAELTIGTRLYLTVLSLFVVFAVAFIVFQQNREKQFKVETLNTRLQDFNTTINETVFYNGDGFSEQALSRFIARHHERGLRVTIIRSDGTIAFDNIRKAIRELRKNRKKGSENYHQKMDRLKSRAAEIEIRINSELFGEARVIACTLVGSAHRLLEGMKFGTLFIDEAAQALEAACWIPMKRASRVILAGDHCQLPPTVKSIAALIAVAL